LKNFSSTLLEACFTVFEVHTHTNILQHTATHCNTLQHTTTHCNTLQLFFKRNFPYLKSGCYSISCIPVLEVHTHINILRHTATHCNTLQCTATHYFTRHERIFSYSKYTRTQTYCSTLQRTATHCNALQHSATHYFTQHKRIFSHSESACYSISYTQ